MTHQANVYDTNKSYRKSLFYFWNENSTLKVSYYRTKTISFHKCEVYFNLNYHLMTLSVIPFSNNYGVEKYCKATRNRVSTSCAVSRGINCKAACASTRL